ncbi:MAG TPA: type IV pilus assembly protein PilM [Caldisericia bacterium]|nr:type IV pilus assembly protein PilM [Caldisericia bacterium]HOL83135.1 type IV pilus assembly protein PilM [Caldisericia bacterium]HPC56859.1 type IV pilus assembly protein PilM [Caldisericia bacterium]HPP43503.1 type IV pilus assembly protein PilM [Caldisericia bacterium]HRU73396.1 type IV pilus assembly protein PilM [Caldisericia bacterium]
MANLFGKSPAIGLDLGSGYIKIAQLKETTKGLNLVNIGLLPTPKGAIENAKIMNPEDISEAIKTLLRMFSFIGKRVVASVSGQLVTVRTLTVDKLPEPDLNEVIKWEIQKILPYKLDEASIDYQILGVVPETEGKKLSVIAAAASLDIINSIVSAIKLAKLEPVAIEIESFAELRLLDFTYSDKYSKNIILLVNSGYSFTSINIIEDGVLRFTRVIPFGGKSLIRVIQDTLKVNEKEAETYLVTACDLNVEKYSKDSDTLRITESVLPIIEEFALEIKRSITYFQGLPNFSGKDFLVILGGGTSKIKGLNDYIKSYLKVQSILDDLLIKGVEYNPKLFTEDYLREMSPFFTVAVGLSMRESFEKFEKAKKLTPKQKLTVKKGK